MKKTTKPIYPIYVVFRSSQSGVWFGLLTRTTRQSRTLREARRAREWTGPFSCSGLALHGPAGGVIEEPVEWVTVDRAPGDEIVACTTAAIEQWLAVRTTSQVAR